MLTVNAAGKTSIRGCDIVLSSKDWSRLMRALLFSLMFLCLVSPAEAARWVPAPGTTFEWILQGYDGSIPAAEAVDVDLFETTNAKVAALNAAGKKTICYISVGSWENWRPDKADYPAVLLGKPLDGWPGERYVDIRNITLLGPILLKRLDLCRAKGFIAIEPDNLDGWQNNTGFAITRADQIRFLKWLANMAHTKGLSIGLKNVTELQPAVIDKFDWALTEDCFAQHWCADSKPFIDAGKAVFAVEYTDNHINFGKFCTQAKGLGLTALLKQRSLKTWSQSCP
jgi:endo-alpha-1,4-polygalactosaminidase (GH114 family)